MKKLFLLISLLTISFPIICDWFEYDRIKINKCLRKEIYEKSGVNIPDINPIHIHLMYKQAKNLNIPIKIMFRLIEIESRFDSLAISHKGAYGYMQIMPGTWLYMLKKLDLPSNTSHTPEMNIIIGTEYLAYLYDFWTPRTRSGEDAWERILASYNAGIGNVIKYKGTPPFKETENYLAHILNHEHRTNRKTH